MENEARIIRLRQLGGEDELDSGYVAPPECEPARLVITAEVDTYPTVAAAIYGVHPTECDGDPVEGGAATYSDDTGATFYALNLGSKIPPPGTRLIGVHTGGIWTIRYDG